VWLCRESDAQRPKSRGCTRAGAAQALTDACRGRALRRENWYRVNRFSRLVRGLAHLLENRDKAGVAFRRAADPFDTTTPADRIMDSDARRLR